MSAAATASLVACDRDFELVEVSAPAGFVLPPHSLSDQDAVLLVREGELDVVIGAERRTIGAGGLLLLPRSVPRRLRVVADVRLLCLAAPTGLAAIADIVTSTDLDSDDIAALLRVAGVALLPAGWAQ